jgi:hypothetical protein
MRAALPLPKLHTKGQQWHACGYSALSLHEAAQPVEHWRILQSAKQRVIGGGTIFGGEQREQSAKKERGPERYRRRTDKSQFLGKRN